MKYTIDKQISKYILQKGVPIFVDGSARFAKSDS